MYALLAVGAVLALWWFTRQSELFCLSVREGKTVVVRGRITTALRTDIADVMRSREIRRAIIKGYRGEHGGSLGFSGEIDEGTQQRLRNIFALYPASSLRNAPAIAKPTLGQLLGIAWLAHFFD
jgi:Protein of unknown function (DUF3634)